jgi:1,4-alpha-glucan branching enzyme
MNAPSAPSRTFSTQSGHSAKKSNQNTLSTPASAPSLPPSAPPSNGEERGERTETSSGSAKTWERSDMHPQNASQEVAFSIHVSPAQEVQLVGDFTDWEKSPIKLRPAPDGSWRTKVILPAGRHLYRYLVDGQWHDDPAQLERVPNAFGTTDHVINIK